MQTAGSGHNRRWIAAAGAGYGLLVLLWAWPLPLHLADSAVLARGADFYQHIWNLWWMRFSLLDLQQNPYVTTYLYYPAGLPLTYHVLDPLDGLLSLPLQAVFGLLPAFNLLRLGQMFFAMVAACALGRVVGLPRPAAWLAGALFACAPVVGLAFDLGQLVEISVGWLPLTILCVIRALGNAALGISPGGWRWVVAGGLALTGSALATWYFFTALVLFIALYVVWEGGSVWLAAVRGAATTTRWRVDLVWLVLRAAAMGAIAGAILSPLILVLLRESASGASYMFPSQRTIIANSSDLLSFFLPMAGRANDLTAASEQVNAGLGWTVLALATVGLVGARIGPGRGRPVFWALVAVAFAVLALGPVLVVGGVPTGLPLPFAVLNSLPFIGAARVPVRFVLLVSLALALLAGWGWTVLAARVRGPGGRVALLGAAAVLAGIEFFNIPRVLLTPQVPAVYAQIAAHGAAGAHEAVLELPVSTRVVPSMLDQTVHGRPILGGYTSRHYPYPWLGATPGVAQLTQLGLPLPTEADILSPPVRASALASLDYYGVRYLAVQPLGSGGAEGHLQAVLDTFMGDAHITPFYQQPDLTVYRVPLQEQHGPFVGLGDGWYAVESAGAETWRWSNGQARVQVTNPFAQPLTATLRLGVYTLAAPRTLIVRLDGRELLRQPVGPHPAQPITLPLALSPGEHWLDLASLEPPTSPPGDARSLSLAFTQVAVEGER